MTFPEYVAAFSAPANIVSIGTLSVPTGWIVACDPFFTTNALPFMGTLAPGSYPVELHMTFSPQAGPRVALARLLLQPGVAAVSLSEAKTGSPQFVGYFVDSGLGTFMDEAARKQFTREQSVFYRDHPKGNFYDDVIAGAMQQQSGDPDHPNVRAHWTLYDLKSSGLNVAIFTTGLGDGSYSSFWALDGDGNPVALVTDFQIL